jgi:hypothetical protein
MMAGEKLNRSESSTETGSRARAKKPYQAPRILSREVIEAVAATCSTSSIGKAVGCNMLNS